ncbi:MAG: TM1802 family CRISPR-associated protein, partial [Promethearchaeota archaeon]
ILIRKVLLMNSIIEFLESIGCLKINQNKKSEKLKMIEIEKTDKDKEDIKLWDEIQNYWENKTIYNQDETRAMFLLGIMIADVGSAQYKNLKSEPILKKINFDGLNRDKIIQLANVIIDLLNKYKVYHFDAQIHSNFTRVFDNVPKENWSLTPSENVFFILSGYAFKRQYLREFISKRKKSETKNNEEEEE